MGAMIAIAFIDETIAAGVRSTYLRAARRARQRRATAVPRTGRRRGRERVVGRAVDGALAAGMQKTRDWGGVTETEGRLGQRSNDNHAYIQEFAVGGIQKMRKYCQATVRNLTATAAIFEMSTGRAGTHTYKWSTNAHNAQHTPDFRVVPLHQRLRRRQRCARRRAAGVRRGRRTVGTHRRRTANVRKRAQVAHHLASAWGRNDIKI